jgi:hypothetical protein
MTSFNPNRPKQNLDPVVAEVWAEVKRLRKIVTKLDKRVAEKARDCTADGDDARVALESVMKANFLLSDAYRALGKSTTSG